MHKLLAQLLEARKIKTVDELSEEEKTDFDRWNSILSDRDITVDSIKEFCSAQIKGIELQWKDLDNAAVKNERLAIMHTVYRSILELIDSPVEERKYVEKHLQELIHKTT